MTGTKTVTSCQVRLNFNNRYDCSSSATCLQSNFARPHQRRGTYSKTIFSWKIEQLRRFFTVATSTRGGLRRLHQWISLHLEKRHLTHDGSLRIHLKFSPRIFSIVANRRLAVKYKLPVLVEITIVKVRLAGWVAGWLAIFGAAWSMVLLWPANMRQEYHQGRFAVAPLSWEPAFTTENV